MMEVSGEHHIPAMFICEESTLCRHWKGRCVGLSHSGHGSAKKTPNVLTEIKHHTIQ
jgi:hypothetical protein